MVLKECYKSYTFEKSDLLNVDMYGKVRWYQTHDYSSIDENQGKMHKQHWKTPSTYAKMR